MFELPLLYQRKVISLEHNDGYRILEPSKLKAREKCKIKRLDFEPIN